MADQQTVQLPADDAKWSENNFKGWPRLMYEDLVDYMILNKAYDGKQMKAFRSLYGKNFNVESNRFGDIYDCKVENLHFLKAAMSPSQSGIGKGDYKSWAVVSDSNIVTGHCTCPAGAGRSCSHIAAILYAVIMAWEYGVAGETCADKTEVCGKGASEILQRHVDLANIVKDNAFKKSCDDNLPKPLQFLTHEDLIEFVNKSPLKPLWECKGTLLNQVLTAQERTVQEKEPLHH